MALHNNASLGLSWWWLNPSIQINCSASAAGAWPSTLLASWSLSEISSGDSCSVESGSG